MAEALTDSELLAVCASERRQSLGFDDDDELASERQKALAYFKGEITDIPALPNRSKAVSTDVADAVETAMPDLVEIFIGGDDVATFEALNGDEDQARIETNAVTHTVIKRNQGFVLYSTVCKDALLTKLGVVKAWIEEEEAIEDETEVLVPAEYAHLIEPSAEMRGLEVEVGEPEESGEVPAKLRKRTVRKTVKVKAWPSEDFAFARDTVSLRDATYYALRSRPRAQTLVDDGFDPDKVEQLAAYEAHGKEQTDQKRDTAGEHDEQASEVSNPALRMMRQVEIVEHFIRVDADGSGKAALWSVVTGNGDKVLLAKEKLSGQRVAVITPYLTPHRLLGQSLADLLLENQRIRTVLKRMLLDSGYFALNQRFEVAMGQGKANEWTLNDVLSNIPGAPVRSEDGASVRPLGSPGLSFDVMGALEYMATDSEQRSGITRNAQGLNPDTLHDTAGGARMLIAAAQKRIRLVARTFAETGIADMFMIVRDLLREAGDPLDGHAIGRPGEQIDPKTWPSNRAVSVEIGVGSGGREHDIAAGRELISMLKEAVAAQGGLNGPLTNIKAISLAARRQTARLGFREDAQYWPDPETFQPPQPAEPPEAAAARLQSETEIRKAEIKAQTDLQIAQARAQADAQARVVEAQSQRDIRLRELELDDAFRRDQASDEIALKERQIETEAELAAMNAMTGANGSTNLPEVYVGGDGG